MMQYPLRPSHVPYTSGNVLAARVCGEGEGLELDIKVRPRGENYSTSQGEHFAQLVAMGSANGGRYERLVVCVCACLFRKYSSVLFHGIEAPINLYYLMGL